MNNRGIRKVIVYANGDSSCLSTWSNVPFFFTKALTDQGITVIRVDLSPTPRWEQLFKKLYQFISIFFKGSTYDYFRSFLHFINIRYRIRKTVRKYPQADAHIFLTFSFSSAGITRKPSVLIGDWTYDHYLSYFKTKQPDYLERQAIRRERKMIEGSDLVFSLFPLSANHIRAKARTKNHVYYIGNAVNALQLPGDGLRDDRNKAKKNILFIGSSKYMEGLQQLLNAFKLLYKYDQELKLNIIGVSKTELNENCPNVTCYGYLDKGNPEDCKVYYRLLNNGGVFVNTTQKWGAFSACIEAMLYYIPVIISPYDEFIATFGTSINFGLYSDNVGAKLLGSQILTILENQNYRQIAINAHDAVQTFTWQKYAKNILKKLRGEHFLAS